MTSQDVNITAFKNQILSALKTNSSTLANKIGKEMVNIMRERTESGYDIYGRKFGGYNKSYNKAYALKYAAAKYGTTQYKGDLNTPLRLTGRLFSSMNYKVLNSSISGNRLSMRIRIFIDDPTQQGKVEGLLSDTGTARNGRTYSKKEWAFLGLSVTGGRVSQEKQRINRILKDYFTNIRINAK
jgi:hypothetical protein